jgi:hypothetical protein
MACNKIRFKNDQYSRTFVSLFVICMKKNSIGGVMVSVLGSIAVDREFEPLTDHTKD